MVLADSTFLGSTSLPLGFFQKGFELLDGEEGIAG